MKRHVLNTLFEYFKITNEHRREEIVEAIRAFEGMPGTFSAVCNFKTNGFIYISPQVETLLGYSSSDFISGGYPFFFSLIPADEIPQIMVRQSVYTKQLSNIDFDYTQPMLMEFTGSFIHARDYRFPVHQFIVVLEFEPGADVRVFFAIWISLDNINRTPLEQVRAIVQKKLNDLHRLILGPAQITDRNGGQGEELMRLKFPGFPTPLLTPKEKALLRLLSKGYSLKKIASQMEVSYFTSERHRKHLFDKFEVKNVAELIMKASKIYWLD